MKRKTVYVGRGNKMRRRIMYADSKEVLIRKKRKIDKRLDG